MDVTNQNYLQQQTAAQAFGGLQPEENRYPAKLIVFQPSIISQQTLRPYAYNFNDNLVDRIANTVDQPTAFAKAITSDKDPNILGAIMPTSDGYQLNTSVLSQAYTFILIIDNVGNGVMTSSLSAGVRRCAVAIGYFHDEPLNPLTGAVNQNAILHFTRVLQYNNTGAIFGQRTIHGKQSLVGDTSVTDTTMLGMLPTTDIYVNTPAAWLKHPDSDPSTISGVDQFVSANGQIINPLDPYERVDDQRQHENHTLNTAYANPEMHLKTIVSGLSAAVNNLQTTFATDINDRHNSLASIGVGDGLFADQNNEARSVAWSAMSCMYGNQPFLGGFCGVDLSQPITMAMLDAAVQRVLRTELFVKPIQVLQNAICGISDQNTNSFRNSMSSLLANSLQEYMAILGVRQLSFAYSSYQVNPTADGILMPQKTGVYQAFNLAMIDISNSIDMNTAENLRYAGMALRNHLENYLFPLFEMVNGPFDINCVAVLGGDIMINLNYLDEPQSVEPYYYVSAGKLGGYLSPNVATLNLTDANFHQFNQLRSLVIDPRTQGSVPPSWQSAIPINATGAEVNVPITNLNQPAAPGYDLFK